MHRRAPSRDVVALKGGLGNQLFQFAFAQYLGREGRLVNLDLSCVRHGVPAIFDVPLIGDRARRMALPVTRLIPSPSGRLPLVGTLSRRIMRPASVVIDESAQGTVSSLDGPPAWWFGYWQRLSYAEPITGWLKAGLDLLPHTATLESNGPSVARLHVRRGDYAGNPMELPGDWYGRALDIVTAVSGRSIKTEVVTNDPAWCHHNLHLGRPFSILPTGSSLEDMQLLALSDYLVVSRSTFSWWAATVSHAKVIAPDVWFPQQRSGGHHDLLPATWLSCPISKG